MGQYVVNFINILRPAFAPIFFCQKITKPNCYWRKAVQNTKFVLKMLVKWPNLHSFSSTFYVQIFRTNIVSAAFFLVTCTLLVRRLYEKRAHIKLMKLTPGWDLILLRRISDSIYWTSHTWRTLTSKVTYSVADCRSKYGHCFHILSPYLYLTQF